MKALILLFSMLGAFAWAQENIDEPAPVESVIISDGMTEPAAEAARDPASESVPGRPAKEEELRVRPQLPEAQVKIGTREVQAQVYKTIYNRELKPDQREDVLDE